MSLTWQQVQLGLLFPSATQHKPGLILRYFPDVQHCEAVPSKSYESYSKIALNQESRSCSGSGEHLASSKVQFWNRRMEIRSHNTGENHSSGIINHRNGEWIKWNSCKQSKITMMTAWLIFTILYLQQGFTAIFLQQESLDHVLPPLDQMLSIKVLWVCLKVICFVGYWKNVVF